VGSIKRTSHGSWRARVWVGGRQVGKTFGRQEDARAWVATNESDKVRGAWLDPSLARAPFEEVAEQYFATVPHLAPSSRTRTEGIIAGPLLGRLRGVPIGAVTPSHIRAIVAELSASELAPGSVRKVYNVLHAIFRMAEEAGMISRSPCVGIRLPSDSRREPRFLSPEELERLAGCIDARYRALVLLGGYAGLRLGELAGLRAERIDFLRRRVVVSESIVESGGRLHPRTTKTGRARVVTLPTLVVEELAAHLAEHPPGADGLVFTAPRGGPLRAGAFRTRYWMPGLEAAGLGHVRIHDLRHTAAALAIRAGAHPKAIADRLGHSSITTTLDRYGHLFPVLDEALADHLDEMARQPRQASVEKLGS
jgi:integrase